MRAWRSSSGPIDRRLLVPLRSGLVSTPSDVPASCLLLVLCHHCALPIKGGLSGKFIQISSGLQEPSAFHQFHIWVHVLHDDLSILRYHRALSLGRP